MKPAGAPRNLQLTQGYEVLAPKSGTAYPVPCEEWQSLKAKLNTVNTPPWVLPAISVMLLGAALTTLITILIGGVAPSVKGNGLVVAWGVVAAAGFSGGVCLLLAMKQMEIERTQVSNVVRQMELIESRFDPATEAPASRQAARLRRVVRKCTRRSLPLAGSAHWDRANTQQGSEPDGGCRDRGDVRLA